MSVIELALGIGIGLFIGNLLNSGLDEYKRYRMRKQMKTLMHEMTSELDKITMKFEKTPVKKPKVAKKATKATPVAKKGKK